MPATDWATEIAIPSSQDERSQNQSSQKEDSPHESVMRTSNGPSKPLKGLLFGFAATVTVGLALASWYVGVRIVAADELGSSTTPSPSQAVNVAPAPPLVVPPPAAAPEAKIFVAPPTSLYLQVAGLGPKQDAAFLKSLHAKGFRAQVQQDNAFILIGPFATQAEIEHAQRKLQSTGVLAVETSY
jgi:cell division septation protein DedD